MRKQFLFSLTVLLLQLAMGSYARAAWVQNGVPVCTEIGNQTWPHIASDGSGGAIIVWRDQRAVAMDIYAQRVNAAGIPLWTANGVAIRSTVFDALVPEIISDGSGGAFIAWSDARSGVNHIYAQRVNAAGVVQWTPNGVLVCNAANGQTTPQLVNDASGGIIIVWVDYRFSLSDADIYAQRLNGAGAAQWTVDGVIISAPSTNQVNPKIVSDGVGGAVIAWQDFRSGQADVYAQRVSAFGVTQWSSQGQDVCTDPATQMDLVLASDGSGGGIIVWTDTRVAAGDIYARRINSGGTPLWTANGIPVCAASLNQQFPRVVSDGNGGIIATWRDLRGPDPKVYAQRVTGTGSPLWTQDGVAVSTAPAIQDYPEMVSDGFGGAIIEWNGFNGSSYLGAQRLDPYGAPLWVTDGAVVTTVGGAVPQLIGDGRGGALVAWRDARSGFGYDNIYAQRVEGRYGAWGAPEPSIVSVKDNPADQGGKVIVKWLASDRDRSSDPFISHYSIWRSTDASATIASASGNNESRIVANPRDIARDFTGSAVWVEHRPNNAAAYWEWVANQDAIYVASYSYTAGTRQDSTVTTPATHTFKVFAHSTYFLSTQVWESAEASGRSVDNLSPGAPLFLTAQRVGADVQLEWNRAVAPDLRDYSIYRATSSGVTPVPINFLASAEDTVATDANAPSSALYYIVTAYDVHANQSNPSNEAHVGALTGIGNLPAVTALTVLQNHPNPFTATTEFQIGLPEGGDVRMEVFDVAGRRVMAIDAKGVKGWQRIPLAARDDRGRSLASGVYFARVSAAGKTITKKMVIAR